MVFDKKRQVSAKITIEQKMSPGERSYPLLFRPHHHDTLDMEPWRQPSLDRHDTNSNRPITKLVE